MTLTPTQAKDKLDAHVRETIEWHFNPATGCSFWLDWARKNWDPRKEITCFEDLLKFLMGEYHKKKVMALVYYGEDAIKKVRPVNPIYAFLNERSVTSNMECVEITL